MLDAELQLFVSKLMHYNYFIEKFANYLRLIRMEFTKFTIYNFKSGWCLILLTRGDQLCFYI